MPHTVTAKRPPTDDARILELPSKVSSVPEARHTVSDDLRNSGVPQAVVDNVLMVVTELVTNAVRHAEPLRFSDTRRGVRLRWIVIDHHVLIDVTDGGGPDQPRLRRAATADPEGRGLAIVDALARDWSVRSTNGEVTVQAVVGPWERRGAE
ncbi:ATP-binding protein [Phytoactinopolyspora alkaliphila]|uniref:ATP-binding protein n=1 Tax=Phytoactinopolyspora alkaliphila TaxID=1783498 RepID=A0A6N9YK29_9ACTN|nr:ATP-binding protein [Phytoactinopolyspora alkaliphila]NED95324.1 ATP-binding protein [Phytoactinopolyspora alkaliphila]